MGQWKIDFDGNASKELERSCELGPIIDDAGNRLFEEQTIARFGGLKVDIFADEHPPPHFRVLYQDDSNNFTIADCTPLNGRGLERIFRNIRTWHKEHKQQLIDAWNKQRPTDCPVGLYRESSR